MADNFEIEVIEQIIEIEVEGASSWNSIADKPEEFPPEEHTHEVEDITDFPETMLPSAHTHEVEDITDFPETMTPSAHNHSTGDITQDINNRFVTDAQKNAFHNAGSDAETATSISALQIDEIDFSLINSYRI